MGRRPLAGVLRRSGAKAPRRALRPARRRPLGTRPRSTSDDRVRGTHARSGARRVRGRPGHDLLMLVRRARDRALRERRPRARREDRLLRRVRVAPRRTGGHARLPGRVHPSELGARRADVLGAPPSARERGRDRGGDAPPPEVGECGGRSRFPRARAHRRRRSRPAGPDHAGACPPSPRGSHGSDRPRTRARVAAPERALRRARR